jgi:uncharacterized cupredoxin-like copper-binding protein
MALVRLVGALGVIIMASLACSSGAAPSAINNPPADTASTLVGVTLGEFSLKTDVADVPAGKVTFAIKNTGAAKHEMVVLQTTDATLPIDSQTGKAAEEATGIKHVGEFDGLDAGTTKALTLDLTAGTYQLICNYPGHYHAGMVATLIVH